MKIQFDPNQPFQRIAVSAVVDLFDGQPRGEDAFTVTKFTGDAYGSLGLGAEQSELGLGNRLLIDDAILHANTRKIQDRNDIEHPDPAQPLEGWTLFDAIANQPRLCPHFSTEMETGTGKTYVYLRTIYELATRYGFKKFIIVVPSVAIREGVLHSIDIMKEHFRGLYNNLPVEHFVYDAKRVNRLRQFATSNTVQIQVINIDKFRKDDNVIFKESDKLSGRQPIEYVQAARPIVIIDEPQSVDNTDKSQEAIKALNPLCTLRYSATHKNPYNLVYRLDPIRAFDLKLVKQIVVASVRADEDARYGYIRLDEVIPKVRSVKAKLSIHKQGPKGPKVSSVLVGQDEDLFVKSGEMSVYKDGYVITEIRSDPGDEHIQFANGLRINLGKEVGGIQDDEQRVQIRLTIQKHLDKELMLHEQGKGIKVLSLFFIDRVANYRTYDADGYSMPGPFARIFDEELAALAQKEKYRPLTWLQDKAHLETVHNGYFAKDGKGKLKDSRGDTQADDEVYNLIMKDKERLLSMDEPLRFLFSHSALREGWDNPNVFQICTLREMGSEQERRQTIGRGLRLPVDSDGLRVMDDSINRLTVIANEGYAAFADALQKEYERDCGVTFGKIPMTALSRLSVMDGDTEKPIGRDKAEALKAALVDQGLLDLDGRILPAFDPKRQGFRIVVPSALESEGITSADVIDLLSKYRMERHVQKDKDERKNPFNKQVLLNPDFKILWDKIKPRTRYRIGFSTDELVITAAKALREMPVIRKPVVHVDEAALPVGGGGVGTRMIASSSMDGGATVTAIPDIIAYLQESTGLTRHSLALIIKRSETMQQFINHPQRYLDQVAAIINKEMARLIVDGIEYERIMVGPDAEWEMHRLEESEKLVDYLTSLKVKNEDKTPYPYIEYDSQVELEFARKMDSREDIVVFVKLPKWFKVDTPVGTYNPDWAIVKRDGEGEKKLYLVRETKGTKDMNKVRPDERDKIRCGVKHFEALGVDYAYAVSGDEV
ncbi:restriction endonuclease [Acidithiobacillus ferrooxidans]|uniref:restriction endonuclease n=1 Tax=Acidithiobacillus ferrooxidans TaxID=920 RepID=UPI0015DCEB37|nr:DEAD/DEAH box helicase family protein [Acidithiobacillus ferrooxidans]MCR1341866.1 DEAD/DEAH box helicase family protein [Acidithiobacillus ferrooxidans]QLK42574.1 type III restriction endonuclease subunit R [Acidithiobacillus ferrooxidans]QZT51657.1 DEAD/DEAH box helicase family protein [Acidithiobacillus ferrooxidans]BDB15020.1 type III restriction endonuclease subunit R [Acidithiobacillus ferrooxidans]